MERNGKVYRNLEGQVAYLTQYLETNALANEMGIKVLGRVDSVDDIPAGDYEYGDAYMVGEEGETPYRMVIWSRDAGDGNPGWFDIGYFPTAPDEFSIVEVNGSPVHVFNADTKLDKQTGDTVYPEAYVKNADGTQSMIRISGGGIGQALAYYVGNGQLNVADPTTNIQAANKGYVDGGFVAKDTTTTPTPRAYTKLADGSQDMYSINPNVAAYTIVGRDGYGRARFADPSVDSDAATKGYVDANTNGKRYLHNLQLTFTITAGIYLSIIGRIINSSNSSITSIGYQEMMDLIVDYGAYEPGGSPNPASVTKCPNSFHQDHLDEPNIGFLAYYKSGGTFNQLYVDSANALTVTDAVTQF